MNPEIIKYKLKKRIYRLTERYFGCINWSFLFKPIETDLLILDDFYPCPLSNFRYIEFNAYLNNYNSVALTTGKSLPVAQIYTSIRSFINKHPSKHKIKLFHKDRKVKAKLAVLVFQHNAEFFLNFLEKNKIPFIFTLYPGGNFKLNDKQGDNELKRIFNSAYFRKVIATQKITRNYLVEKKMCIDEKIEFIYGCPMEIPERLNPIINNNLLKTNICFVAAKYHPTGMDKGYDILIDTARLLLKKSDKYSFHIVGGFNESDIEISDIKANFKYYGYLDIRKLREIYAEMDIILSPNRSNILASGAFDGFPTAAVIEAGLAKTVMVLTDDMQQNFFLENNVDCIFINYNATEIADIIEDLSQDAVKCHLIAENGAKKLSLKLNFDSQFNPRFKLIDSLID